MQHILPEHRYPMHVADSMMAQAAAGSSCPRAFQIHPEGYPSADPSGVTATCVQVTASVLRNPFQSQHFAPELTLFCIVLSKSDA